MICCQPDITDNQSKSGIQISGGWLSQKECTVCHIQRVRVKWYLPLSSIGSHDSFSYWVDEKSPVGPDQATAIKRLAKISLVKKLMKKWSVTQNLTFKEQLDGGIRYFDLRVSSKPGETGQEIYFIHGLFGIKVWDGLMEINNFLTHHPTEVVFLDFNHFYAMDNNHHLYLIRRMQEIFESKLCTKECVENVTLQSLWDKQQQVSKSFHFTGSQMNPLLFT